MTEYASIRPSDFSEGGGAPIQMNLLVLESRLVQWDYEGKSPTPTLALRLSLKNDEGETYSQYYSAGDLQRFVPSEDGKRAKKVGTAEKISKSTNMFVFFQAVVNAGFPENKLEGDVSVIEGLYAYWDAKTIAKRGGLEGSKETIITVPTKMHKLPWEEAKTEAPEPTNNNGAMGKLIGLLGTVLEQKGGKVERQDLGVALFSTMSGDPDVTTMAQLIHSPELLVEAKKAGYKVEGEVISK